MGRLFFSFCCAVVAAVVPLSAVAEVLTSTLQDQQSIAVAIYNRDLALIRDHRRIRISGGIQTLAFREISAEIQAETALLSSNGMQVLEQNFEYDLLTPQSLLQKYVGREVTVVTTHPVTGEEQRERALVLSAVDGVVLKIGDRIETGIPGRIVYPDVPENLRDRPTLTMLVSSTTGGDRDVELSYLTGGLSWQADYIGELAADDSSIDMRGWVTLANDSGVEYRHARLQLVAGDVHRIRRERLVHYMKTGVVADRAEPARGMAEETMFAYHLYTLDRPTTIRDRQKKQVALMQAAGVSCRKQYVLQGQGGYYSSRVGEIGRKMKVAVIVELKNDTQSGLGLPLPAGIIRVYKKDSRGYLQFVGEDRIGHTPKNGTLRLQLGDAFDVTADKKQVDFKKLSGFSRYNYSFESGYEITLHNGGDREVTVRVLEQIPGDWKILSESADHVKKDSRTAQWLVRVPAGSKSLLCYRVQVKY